MPGDVKGYEGIIAKKEGYWSLSGASGRYRFDPVSGWLTSFDSGEKFGCFICKKIQPHPLQFASSFSKVTSLKILSSEIMTEIQRKENAGALFVLPSQLNGAEYPSHTHVVKEVEEYKRDNTGGPRGQLAAHPAAAQFLSCNRATALFYQDMAPPNHANGSFVIHCQVLLFFFHVRMLTCCQGDTLVVEHL